MTDIARLAPIAADARWLPHRYDPGGDCVHFLWVDREAHRAATFLTDAYLRPAAPPLVLRRRDIVGAVSTAAPLHLILHSAFCCSSLVARLFDREGWAMGLKEPVILNDLVGWEQRGAPPDRLQDALDDALHLLQRPFAGGEAVIVKPANIVNLLAARMLELRQHAKAILIHAPLRDFLGSVARKGLEGRLWVRTVYLTLLKGGVGSLGFDQDEIFGQTDLQIAAAGWLVQQRLFHGLVARFGAARVRTLDSDRLLADPARSVGALARHFELDDGPHIIADILAGRAFTTDSKRSTAPFDQGRRKRDRIEGLDRYHDEIEQVAIWAEQVAAYNEIPLTLPVPLI